MRKAFEGTCQTGEDRRQRRSPTEQSRLHRQGAAAYRRRLEKAARRRPSIARKTAARSPIPGLLSEPKPCPARAVRACYMPVRSALRILLRPGRRFIRRIAQPPSSGILTASRATRASASKRKRDSSGFKLPTGSFASILNILSEEQGKQNSSLSCKSGGFQPYSLATMLPAVSQLRTSQARFRSGLQRPGWTARRNL